MLNRLMRDHKHIAILLKILNKKRAMLENGDSVNFNLVRDIVEYMQSYAEHSHHPLEDVIYDYCLQKYPSVPRLDRLSKEHQALVESSAALMGTLNLILCDVVVAKEKLIDDLSGYVRSQEEHMLFEEREMFPLLSRQLTDEDWHQINERCLIKLVEDPLFSDNDNQLFDELKNYLSQSD
ncbi:hemerythrin domain-containing protein [Shewanella khirikhana]|uniref:Hemerythrin HHE cation binding domain protein n=1 Tax=Shewanella khirikhana TaxID=1965282 RepID=A0ABM7CZT0_9GAMM|nr:hemerythrin domain-containing protein [Shewanella khirikhana]AZQ09589.1 Hemerythrin HHE cation binding domain protein [Shewanella khirikhana]